MPLRGPSDATHLFSAEGLKDGIWILRWQTSRGEIRTIDYKPYPRRPIMPDPTVTQEPLLYQLWQLLDDKCDIIMTADPLDNDLKRETRKRAESEARGLAEALAIIMYPFYENANAVVREAVTRRKARAQGMRIESPGLGEHMFDPHFNHDGTPRVPVAQPKARTAVKAPSRPPAPEKVLSEKETQTVKEMLASKMMGAEELAKMFGVSVTTIVKLG
jgi:hypothetical protein